MLGRLRQRFARWLLRDVKLDGLHVGTDSIILSPTGADDVLRWTTAPAVAQAGDFAVSNSTGRATAFIGSAVKVLSHQDEVGSVLGWGSDNVGTLVDTRYLAPWRDTLIGGLTPLQLRVPRAGTLKNLRVRHNTVGVGANNLSYTVRKNSTGTAVVVTMAATASDGSDTSNSVAVAAGDLLDIEVTKSGVLTTSPLGIVATLEYAP